MQLLGLIEGFKNLTQFTDKVMSVEGEGAMSIEEMEQMIKDCLLYTSDAADE